MFLRPSLGVRHLSHCVAATPRTAFRTNGQQLGYLGQHISRGGHQSGIAYRMDHGRKYLGRISDITGGRPKQTHYGVNIEIREADDDGDVWTYVPPRNSNVRNSSSPTITQVLVLLAIVVITILLVVMNER